MSLHPLFPPTNRGRGGFAPRSGRVNTSALPMRRSEIKPDTKKHPLGDLLKTITHADLPYPNDLHAVSNITDCKYVASYNWLDDYSPKIIVPGEPAVWSPLSKPQRLKEDHGQYFRDPNAARSPTYPTEPAIRAILASHPDFKSSDVDIFACGSTMGSLLRFVRSVDKAFRFQVQLIGNTVFFIRKESDPKELINGVHGFGHTFPEAYTTWDPDVKGSETHQRMVQYQFGGHRCLIRFECDGYLKEPEGAGKQLAKPSHSKGIPSDQSLVEDIQAMGVTSTPNSTSDPLVVKPGGSVIPQASIFDLKTRSGRYRKEINMEEFLPILWLKQIPNFIVAYHDGAGLFENHNINVRNVKKVIEGWEIRNRHFISQLAFLLKRVVEIARTEDTGKLEVYSAEVGVLEIRKQYGNGEDALPAELMARWKCGIANDGMIYDDSLDDNEPDYTACSAEDCGYCGKCTY